MIRKASTLLFVLLVMAACKKEVPEQPENKIQNSLPPSLVRKPTPLPANGKYAEMTFNSQEHDFGTITQGDKVVYDFQFKNTGGSDLVIANAKGSCGCTVPEYPKEPVAPGASGIIKVSFNSAGKIGEEMKSVTVFCNVKEGNKVLIIKSNIVSEETK